MSSRPHATVATIVECDNQFLMVKEKRDGRIVFNQPAGHIENGESILEAAIRETHEETRWLVEPNHFLGVSSYHAPNGITYIRTTISAKAVRETPLTRLDTDILDAIWMSYEEILTIKEQLRSPIVLKVIDDYRRGNLFPLDLIYEQR